MCLGSQMAAQTLHPMELYRIGIFFILVGVILLMLFGMAAKAGAGNAGMLFWGLLSLVFGLFLYFRLPRPPRQSSGRFRILHGGRRRPSDEELHEDEDEEE